ncbi:A24 family peptidase [uncultured Microbacterium sp.]|uniref:prepilin peptidase n=1 Tax=uncultured Microbacterium sp. TaxID=191216 RepID=UPI0025EEFA5F|nr:A24 family peptidase [uncultured Microbacterium sp.]
MDLHALLVLLAHGALLAVGARLIVVDVQTHRLPDRIVLPTLAGAILLVLAETAAGEGRARADGALWGMLLLTGFYAMLRAIGRDGMGGGDVKLAAVIGLVLGWHGGAALLIGGAAAFVLGAGHALWMIALRRADGSTHLAFGPWMILGGVLGMAAG